MHASDNQVQCGSKLKFEGTHRLSRWRCGENSCWKTRDCQAAFLGMVTSAYRTLFDSYLSVVATHTITYNFSNRLLRNNN